MANKLRVGNIFSYLIETIKKRFKTEKKRQDRFEKHA